MRKNAKVTVSLKASDWSFLSNFVKGDLDNMPCEDENRRELQRILDAITLAVIKREAKR